MRTAFFGGLRIVLFPIVLGIGSVPAQAQDANSDVYGRWRVTRDVSPEGAITGRNESQLRAIIGKVAVIGPEKFAFNGSDCNSPKYTRSADDTATYFYREWRVNSDEMPLGDKLTIVQVDCDLHFLYPVDRNRLIIADDGDFFEAVRVGSGVTQKSPTAANNTRSRANADIFGTWTINGVNWGRATPQSKKKANIFIGMPVYISASRFFYNENTCKQPTYKRSKQNKASHFHGDWRADPARLPLPKILTIIETDCGTIYPVSKHRILIEDKSGTFFSAMPLSGESPG
jgi:hypothetical protein